MDDLFVQMERKMQDLQRSGEEAAAIFGENELELLRSRGISSLEELCAATIDDQQDAEFRQFALWLLAWLDSERTTRIAIEVVQTDRFPELRAAAARALLSWSDTSEASAALLTALQTDENAEVRKSAAYALGGAGKPAAIEALVETLANPFEQPAVRGMAAEQLGTLCYACDSPDDILAVTASADPTEIRLHAGIEAGQVKLTCRRSALPALLAALHDPQPEVRGWAVFALGRVGGPNELPAIVDLVGRDFATAPGLQTVAEEAAQAEMTLRCRWQL